MKWFQFRLSTVLLAMVLIGQALTWGTAWLRAPKPETIINHTTLRGGGPDVPTIASSPPAEATIGAIFCYHAQAGGARFVILSGPEKMTCSPDGIVLWLPRCRGVYPVSIAAVGPDGGHSIQRWVVSVR
jgi:hypothetical protein